MKRILVILIAILLATPIKTKASHLLGGEISWECITSGSDQGKFVFSISLYRACVGVNLGSSASITNPLYQTYGGPSTITCTRIYQKSTAPNCWADSLEMGCGVGGLMRDNVMEEHKYVSAPVQINGTPAATGSPFYFTSCCRPATSVMQNIVGNGSYYLRAVMFPYTDPSTNTVLSVGSTTGGPTCYDSSPYFAEPAKATICTGYKFTYNHNAIDDELDSLHYEWSRPLLSATNGVTWKPGYSTTSQLPGTYHNTSNVPAYMNPLTGEITFTAYSPQGNYHSTGIKVESYKCRQKVAEIYRDIPVVLVGCPPTPTIPPLANTPPDVTFKWNPNDPFPIPLPAGDTVWAGDFVDFYVTSTDIEFRPPGFTGQTNYMIPAGSQLGANFADTNNGCKYPPCAVLDTTSGYFNGDSMWWEGQYGIATYFYWQTNCNHLAEVNACFVKSNTYNFIFKVQDDWCPAPGLNYQTFAVTVLAPPALEPPQMKCAKVAPNGAVTLRWTQPVTKPEDTLNSFRKYVLMRSDSAGYGPGVVYDTLHSVFDMDSLVYTDTSTYYPYGGRYYMIRGISSCNNQGDSILGDTISAMYLTAVVINSGNSVALDWNDYNPGNRWGPKTTGEYYIHQILNGDTTIVDTTTESWDTLNINLCFPSNVEYMITVVDTSSPWGCTSNSTIAGGLVGDNLAPPTVQWDSVSFDNNNNIILGWQFASGDVGTYYIYQGGTLIDSIAGNLNTYTYTPATVPGVYNFQIQARDTCGNINTPGIAQQNVGLAITDVIRCDTNKKVILDWNIYTPVWGNTALDFLLYRSVNNGPYVLIDSLPPGATHYEDTNVTAPSYYRYKIRSRELGTGRGVWSNWDSTTIDRFVGGTVLNAPELSCIEWLNDSTTRLTWKPPTLTDTNFNRYVIFYSNTGSNFIELDSISGFKTSDNVAWDSTQYTHVNVDTGSSHFYYVVSSSGCDGLQRSTKSKTFKALDLTVTSINDTLNQLDWTKITNTAISSNYEVFRDITTSIAQPPYGTETADDVMFACNRNVTYRVEMPGLPGTSCTSVSKEVIGNFTDDTPPSKQFVDSVSMLQDSSFTGMIGWSNNKSGDVTDYVVVRCEAGSYSILDTISATSQLYYLDENNAPLPGVTQYSVAAIDSCGNDQMKGMNFDCHSTIFLTTKLDFCDQSASLNWNPYTDFTSGLGVQYAIYVSVDGGPFIEAGRSDVPSFKYSNLNNGSEYCFFVQAWDNDGQGPFSSSSAVECIDAIFIDVPSQAYLRYATVAEENVVRLCMKVDIDSKIGEYWVKRSTDRYGEFNVVATVPLPDPPTSADSNFCYQDDLVKTNEYSYFYQIDIADPCGVVSTSSNIGRTMLLDVSVDNEKNRNILRFNSYEDWDGDVKEYYIMRGLNDESIRVVDTIVMSQIGEYKNVVVDGDMITFVDDVKKEATTGNGEFCYMIAAIEGANNQQGVWSERSQSNVVCVVQYPLFYVPTAFTPNGDGLNDRFLPLGAFHDVKSYQLDIYNRWGEMIYSSTDYKSDEAGWDGTYNGKPVPSGAYVYKVKYRSADGQEYEKEGTITIAR